MPQDLTEFLRILLPALLGGAAAYAGIRADLARITEKAMSAKESAGEAFSHAQKAHDRIDRVLSEK